MALLAFLSAATGPNAPDLIAPAAKGFLHGMLMAWPLLLLTGLAGLAKFAYRFYRRGRLAQSGIGDVDRMDGQTFEVFLSTLFRRLDYSVEVTRYQGDYGADLVVAKEGRRTVVQAKRRNSRVSIRAVQEAVAAKAMYACDAAMVVANREFTAQARRLARANQVELWDRDVLVGKLLVVGRIQTFAQERERASRSVGYVSPTAPNEPVLSVEPGSPQCAKCGAEVSRKVYDYCLARPGHFGGRIYCFDHQRDLG